MKVRPLHDRVLVKRVEEEQLSRGGIIIPDSAKEKPIKGQVAAVGKGKLLSSGELRPLTVKEDDVILFSKYAGTEVKIDGSDFLIMREDDILGVISE
jgi:chaperonin GroES